MTDKRIALVAHDAMKEALIAWAKQHIDRLEGHTLYATGSTGTLLEKELGLTIRKLESGPLGGDQQLGAMIAERAIDMLIFFSDPLQAQPHEPDVRALLRISTVWNIPVACNLATADYMLTSSLFDSDYQPDRPDFQAYRDRFL